MKKIIFILITIIFSSCVGQAYEYTIVQEVSLNSVNPELEKYRIELEFFGKNQYLYTDSIYKPGDTLYFTKHR